MKDGWAKKLLMDVLASNAVSATDSLIKTANDIPTMPEIRLSLSNWAANGQGTVNLYPTLLWEMIIFLSSQYLEKRK